MSPTSRVETSLKNRTLVKHCRSLIGCSAKVVKRMWKDNGRNASNLKLQICELGCRRKHWRKIEVGTFHLSLRPLLLQNYETQFSVTRTLFSWRPPSSRLTKVTLFGDHAEHTSCKPVASSIMHRNVKTCECESDVFPNKPHHPMVPQLVGIKSNAM